MAVEPSYSGKTTCIECRKPFISADRIRLRRCPGCKDKERKNNNNNRIRTYAYHGPTTHTD